jgi:predicted amidohydrolase YtcJ
LRIRALIPYYLPMSIAKTRRERLPLLHDNHNHISLYAALAGCPDLAVMDAGSARSFLQELPRDRLTVVRGWRTNELMLNAEELAGLPPVLLINFSLHGFGLSDAALPFVKPELGDLVEHRHDAPWCEANVPRLFEAYCDLAGLNEDKLATFMAGLKDLGIGSAEDLAVAGAKPASLMRQSALRTRMGYWASPKQYAAFADAERRACSGIKLFLDGSLGARSAAIRGPWLGAGAGIVAYTNDELDTVIGEAGQWSTGLAIHAIGGIAIDQALAALERALREGAGFSIIRLEHVQFIDAKQARKARELGLILSMQPNFSSDSRDYADRLPAAALEANNPFRMLIDDAGFRPGRDLIFGSDGMPHGIAYPAREALFPAYPGQALSLEELVAGYGQSRGIEGTVWLEIDEERRTVRLAPDGRV